MFTSRPVDMSFEIGGALISTSLSICICGKRTQLEIDGFGFTEYATTRNVTCEVLTLSDCVKVQNVWWYRDGFIEM